MTFNFTNCCGESSILLHSFDQDKSSRQSENRKAIEIRKPIMAKMIDVQNVNKLNPAPNKMEVGKLRNRLTHC